MADSPDSPWLEEVHSKIWNRKELEPELFRKVKVTQAHYIELQTCLKEQRSDRDLPEYNGKSHNVLSVKLDFLRSISPLFRWHADKDEVRVDYDDDSEANNEDCFEINSFFPFTLRFLDFSTLDLKEKLPNYIPLPLFLRQEYDHISALIKKEPRNSQGSVIVSGQPGTGEALVSLISQDLTSFPISFPISRQDRVFAP